MARLRADALEAQRRTLEKLCDSVASGPSLEAALRQRSVALLAEVKRRSPSKGAIAEGLDAVTQARAYAAGGAAAVSVLTEPEHFGGSVDDLRSVRREVGLPT